MQAAQLHNKGMEQRDWIRRVMTPQGAANQPPMSMKEANRTETANY